MNKYLAGIPICILLLCCSCKWQKSSEENNHRVEKRTVIKQDKIGVQVWEMPNRIWSVFQDKKGHYWFGSNGYGIYHYDDTSLVNIKMDLGLVDNSIRGIQDDHLGNVYIQTPKGVSKYDGKSFTTLPIKSSSSTEWKLTPNDLWFNCNGNPNHVYRYDGDSLQELELPPQDLEKAFGGEAEGLGFSGMNNSPYSVFSIDKDKDGNLWIGTATAGAFRYDGESFLWFGEKELSTLPDGRVPGVRSIRQDKNGYFWLSNFISKYKIVEKDGSITYTKSEGMDSSLLDDLPYYNSSVTDDNGDIWFVSYSGDVWKYDGEKFSISQAKDGDTELLIVSIYKDNNGTLWIGTDNMGPYRWNGLSFEKFVDWKVK